MNPNLVVWISDSHVVSDDAEHGIVNETHPTEAAAVAAYIASLSPAGVFDTGDLKDHYGSGQGDEHDRYIENVKDKLPWLAVNPGGAPLPILPGNHDELDDYTAGVSDFSPFNLKFWSPPYHWTADWAAPHVRIIALHSRIVHVNEGSALPYNGFFAVDSAERQWLRDQLAGLPAGWQAIVCSHGPLNPTFGANIGHWSWLTAYGGAELQQILRDNSGKVCAYLNGHRHGNMETNVLDGITHINGPGMAYTIGNGSGGFVPITYDPAARTLTFDFLKGPPSSYPRITGYTPIVVQLPALPDPPPPPPLDPSFSFEATGTVTIDGVTSTATLVGTGTIT